MKYLSLNFFFDNFFSLIANIYSSCVNYYRYLKKKMKKSWKIVFEKDLKNDLTIDKRNNMEKVKIELKFENSIHSPSPSLFKNE